MSTWEENVRKVTPYTPGEQPNRPQMIKLNTNENPYPPAPGVAEVLRHPDEDALRRYPDPAASVLVNALAENYHVNPEQVFVGVGSDDVLAMAFMTFFNSENRSCSRISVIPSILYGQKNSGSHIRGWRWMRISASARKITMGRMAVSSSRTPMLLQHWLWDLTMWKTSSVTTRMWS